MYGKRLYQALSWPVFIAQQGEWLPPGPLVMVVPDGENKGKLASLIAPLHESAIMTVTELVERYAVTSLGTRSLISLSIMESLISAVVKSGLVPYLNIETHRQGYIRAITSFLNNFRCSATGNLEDAFSDFVMAGPGFREKDLVTIHGEYEQLLLEQGFDYRSALDQFFARVDKDNICSSLGFTGSTGVVFFGFTHLTPLEAKFFKNLLRYLPRSVFLYCSDEKAAEQARRIETSLKEVGEVFPPGERQYLSSGGGIIDPFVPVARALFQPAGEKSFRHDLAVHTGKANNRYSEIATMAGQIKELHHGGVGYDGIKVIVPEYDLYYTIISEVFPGWRIPFALENGLPLVSFPLAMVINALVSQGHVSNPYPLREMIFTSPYTCWQSNPTAGELFAYQVAAELNELTEQEMASRTGQEGVKGITLDYPYLKNLTRRAYRDVNPAPGLPVLKVVAQYLDQQQWNTAEEKKAALFQALQQLYTLREAEKALSFGQARFRSKEFQTAVLELLERFNMAAMIRARNQWFACVQEQGTAPAAVEETDRLILEEVKRLLHELVQKTDPQATLPLPDLTRAFERMLKEARCHKPQAGDGSEKMVVHPAKVSIEPVAQGHYRSADYTFLCGLVDGEFPAREEFNFLQPHKEGLGLGRAYTSVDFARNRLYHLVRSTRKALYLSAPVSYNGRMLPPSPFIQDLSSQAAQKQERAKPQEDPHHEKTSPPKPFSRRDKLAFIGKHVDEDYELVQPLLLELSRDDPVFARRILDILRYDGLTMRATALSEYDGLFGVAAADGAGRQSSGRPAVQKKLAEIIGGIAFTPEVIERYASCPLRFFLDNVMGLKKEPDYHPDTTERGMLIRTFLGEYTKAAVEEGGVPPRAAGILHERITAYFAARADEFTDAFEKRFQNRLTAGLMGEKSGRSGLFAAFIDHEQEAPDLLIPFAHGLRGELVLADGFSLAIEIDRLDLAPTVNSLFIYQYSTADRGDVSKVLRGLRFGLPLSLLYLAENLEESYEGKTLGGAGVYLVRSPRQIKRGGYLALEDLRAKFRDQVSDDNPLFSGQRQGFFDPGALQVFLQAAREEVLRIYSLMHRGVFHLPLCSEADQSCANCAFTRICRKDQLRLDRLYFNLQNEPGLYRVRPAEKLW